MHRVATAAVPLRTALHWLPVCPLHPEAWEDGEPHRTEDSGPATRTWDGCSMKTVSKVVQTRRQHPTATSLRKHPEGAAQFIHPREGWSAEVLTQAVCAHPSIHGFTVWRGVESVAVATCVSARLDCICSTRSAAPWGLMIEQTAQARSNDTHRQRSCRPARSERRAQTTQAGSEPTTVCLLPC